ncbi:MAG: hypothetical protein AAGC60_22195 [Acidobacteriota bacterium]
MAEFNDLDSLDDLEPLDDLGDSDPFAAPAPPSLDDTVPAAGAQPAQASGLAAMIQDLLARRNFRQVLQIAETQRDAIERDPQVQAMVQKARQELEQDAYVQSFLDAARKAQAAGQTAQAADFVAKARSLAPNHPDVAAFASAAPAAPQPAAPQPAAPQPAAPQPTADAFGDESPLTFDDDDDDLQFDLDEPPPLVEPPQAAAPAPPQPAAPAPAPPQPAAASPDPDDSFAGLDPFPELGTDLDDDLDALGPLEEEPAAGAEALPSVDGVVDLDEAPAAPDQSAKIQKLLAEGRMLFEAGELQGAIDVWSRIFLIDIDHAEASRLIEEARAKKAEKERRAEEIFHQACEEIEAGSLDAAKASLGQVLELQPGHPTASDYLEQLEAGEVPVIARAESTADAADGSPIDLLDDGGLGAIDSVTGNDEGHSLEAAVARDRLVVVKRTDKKLVAIGAVVALVAVGLVGFLITQWDNLFPNTESAAMAPPPRIDPIDRARSVYEQGKVENAVLLLEKIQPIDESYQEAQALIAQWKAEIDTPDSEQAGPSEEMIERRRVLLDAARTAFDAEQFLRARKYFDRANRISPLETGDLSLRREAERRVEVFAEEVALFEDGKYEEIIPSLWRKREENPQINDISRLLVDAYYNLALTDLQRQRPNEAAEKLGEALEVEPDNEELQRLRLFAEAYSQQSRDLLYRIYVKYLPART